MPRCARAVSITGYYHVFDRGNSKQIIFEDDSDRYRFLSDISDRFARLEVAVLAWCLMDNHFHLMVDDPFDNLSKAMQCALTAYAKYFIGQSYLNPLTNPESGLFLANVTFEPGCRNNWHIHHAKKGGGQMLICTAGEGWYQEEGKAPVSLTAGTVITIPPEVKHWHGAKKDSWFSHISVEVPGEDTSNEWCEPVTEKEYCELEER